MSRAELEREDVTEWLLQALADPATPQSWAGKLERCYRIMSAMEKEREGMIEWLIRALSDPATPQGWIAKLESCYCCWQVPGDEIRTQATLTAYRCMREGFALYNSGRQGNTEALVQASFAIGTGTLLLLNTFPEALQGDNVAAVVTLIDNTLSLRLDGEDRRRFMAIRDEILQLSLFATAAIHV
jgi:hypothetical protein